ncbi:MAG: class I SAM-dependent methyltransferase [Gemmatimonadaceae bacterium]
MFTESPELYDAIYFTFKDYEAEAADIANHIRAAHPRAHTVLDVACGTGEHARLLAAEHHFVVDGLDLNPEFLRLARQKHPAGQVHVADMTAFALARRYDALICMSSSIGYVRTLAVLERTLRCFRQHLAPAGVIIVEPWFPPEVLGSGYHSTRSAEAGGVRVHRTGTTEIDGRICRLRFDYRIEEAGSERESTEVHELGLFTVAETLEAFAAAGLAARHEAPSSRTRGLYIATAAA